MKIVYAFIVGLLCGVVYAEEPVNPYVSKVYYWTTPVDVTPHGYYRDKLGKLVPIRHGLIHKPVIDFVSPYGIRFQEFSKKVWK